MMPLFSDFIQRFRQITWRYRNAKLSEPNNLVRLCRKRTEFMTIINEAVNSRNNNWNQELIDRVIQYVLEEESSGISVYRSDTLDPLNFGHALAVIAEGIAQDSFRASQRKRKSSCTRGSLLIPTACLPKTASYEFTPENNLDFYPANNHHFDLTINNSEDFAIAILNGINQRNIAWSFLGNEKPFDGTYRLQAAIAYSHCLNIFGKLDPDRPPPGWIDGRTITASQQIETLKYLAQTAIVDSPEPE